MPIFYVDGKYVDALDAGLPLTDLLILRGFGVFDFLRTYNGIPFRLVDHIERLRHSAELLHLSCPWENTYIKKIVFELLQRNGLKEANVRFLITGGDSNDSITFESNPRLVIMVTELRKMPREWYVNGVKIVTTSEMRYLPEAKSTDYIKAIHALEKAKNMAAIEAVYHDEEGCLLEGTTSNLFYVREGRLLTAGRNILAGITRRVILELVKNEIDVEFTPLRKDEFKLVDEMFLTASNKEIVPVTHVDDVAVKKYPGPVTLRVMDLFRRYTLAWQGE